MTVKNTIVSLCVCVESMKTIVLLIDIKKEVYNLHRIVLESGEACSLIRFLFLLLYIFDFKARVKMLSHFVGEISSEICSTL